MASMPPTSSRAAKQSVTVDGRRMAYVDTGAGDPIVFLHGNPTSSYLWRNVILHVQGLGRRLAPDLVEGESADVTAIVDAYARWLSTAPVPKLFVNAEPGAILIGAQRELCRRWPNQQEVTVPRVHFIQEDSPDAIGQAIADWLRSLP